VKRDSWQRTVNTKTKWKRGQGVLVGAWGEKQKSTAGTTVNNTATCAWQLPIPRQPVPVAVPGSQCY
jgi:hypothetical protein